MRRVSRCFFSLNDSGCFWKIYCSFQKCCKDSIIQSSNSKGSTMSTKSQNEIAKQILILKKKIYVSSTELENFLQYLDQNVFKRTFSFCGPAKCQERPEFMRAFCKLSNIEKADYYLCCLKIVYELNKKEREEELLEVENDTQDFEISYRLNNSKEWIPTVITIDSSAKVLYFNSTKQSIRLQNYIIRYSKCKDRNAFALECAIGKNFYETIRITHTNFIIFEEIQTKIRNIIVACIKKRILSMINVCKKVSQLSIKNKMMKRQSISVAVFKSKERKSLRDLIQQSTANLHFTIQDYNAISGTLVDQSVVQNIDKFQEYQQISKDVFIHTNKHRVKKVYIFNETIISKDWLVEQLTKYQNFKIWKSSLFMISLLAQIPTQKSLIFHEIDMYKDSIECDYVYLRHYFVREQKSYFIDRSISTLEYGSHQTSNSRGNIHYCIWRIQSLPNKRLQVIVECEISHVDCTDIYDVICEQIGQLEKIVLCKSGKQKVAVPQSMEFQNNQLEAISYYDEMNQFTSYQGISENIHSVTEDEAAFYSIYSSDKKIQDSVASEEIWEFQERKNIKIEPKKYSYQITPDKNNGVKVYKTFKNNTFFDESECIVNEHGDLLFVNEQKIKAQSSVLKNVLKRIGTNFFSGKSILNVSLPIQIFATDTNLERLCKSTAYAPLFLQNKSKAQPLQKMKAVIAFSIGNILLYINMAKPFNPVIGETFQGFIDGCPIYGEQTFHHPPISTLFFVGRGYFVSANLQAKVEFGLNNVSGINEGLYKVAFHQNNPNENVICYFSPPGQLSGAIFGQRKLALINKTRYFDQKNQIFCEISWGKNKSSKQTNYSDYMEGKIVSLAQYQTDIYKIKTSKQDKILGKIWGRWTQKIYFNQQIIFDVNGVYPFEVIEEIKPLLSDGKFRRDRVLVEQKKLAEAQQAKEQIEEAQRRDRRLRKQYTK